MTLHTQSSWNSSDLAVMMAPLRDFADRLFHVHAKDLEIQATLTDHVILVGHVEHPLAQTKNIAVTELTGLRRLW